MVVRMVRTIRVSRRKSSSPRLPAARKWSTPVPGDGTISNTENTLVARFCEALSSAGSGIPRSCRLSANARRRRAEVISALVRTRERYRQPGVGEAAGFVRPRELHGGGGPWTLAQAGRRRRKWAADGGLPDADSYSPELSVLTSRICSLRLRIFSPTRWRPSRVMLRKLLRVFDHWLRQTTGRTARQHNPNFPRRQAARWAKSQGCSGGNSFPHPAKRVAGSQKVEKEAKMRRHADESLDVAAPQDRIDVEALSQ